MAQGTHRGQFSLELPMRFLGGKSIKQIRKLYAAAHEFISRFVAEPFADKSPVYGVKHHPHGFAGTDKSISQRFQKPQIDESKHRQLLVGSLTRSRQYCFQMHASARLVI